MSAVSARIPIGVLETLKRRAPLSAIVGRDVKLKRIGSKFGARCPFHTEKSPSFFVDDAKGFYHCFGCVLGTTVCAVYGSAIVVPAPAFDPGLTLAAVHSW